MMGQATVFCLPRFHVKATIVIILPSISHRSQKKYNCLVLKTEYTQVGIQKVNYWYSWYYCAILNSQDVTDIVQIADQQLDCKA